MKLGYPCTLSQCVIKRTAYFVLLRLTEFLHHVNFAYHFVIKRSLRDKTITSWWNDHFVIMQLMQGVWIPYPTLLLIPMISIFVLSRRGKPLIKVDTYLKELLIIWQKGSLLTLLVYFFYKKNFWLSVLKSLRFTFASVKWEL